MIQDRFAENELINIGLSILDKISQESDIDQSHHKEQIDQFDILTDDNQIAVFQADDILLAKQSYLIGYALDGLPIILDFDNPNVGSILIKGDRRLSNQMAIYNLLHDLSREIDTDPLDLYLITSYTNKSWWLKQNMDEKHIILENSSDLKNYLIEFVSLAEQRRNGRERGLPVVILIEEFDVLINYINDDDRKLLYWLIQHGPYSNIFIIATAINIEISKINNEFDIIFPIQIYTLNVDEKFNSVDKSLIYKQTKTQLGQIYQVQIDQEWIDFTLV
jgi:hypothetical protein